MKKINFILNGVANSGGGKVIRIYVSELIKRGYDVQIYFSYASYAYKKGIKGQIYKFLSGLKKFYKYKIRNELNDVKQYNYKVVPFINDKYIRDADITIATAWVTAYDVIKLNEKKGKKYYFIQDYEIWDNEILGKKTYELNLNKIVISTWIKNKIEQQGIKDKIKLLYNGVDIDTYKIDNKVFEEKNTINCLMLSHNLEKKGVEQGLRAFELAKEKYGDLNLIMFGLKTPHKKMPDYIKFVENPSISELVKLYHNTDIYIFPSKEEGWGLTVTEAMASKCAVVGTNTGCMLDIGKNEENALISEPNDIIALANNIIRVAKDTKLREEISLHGYNTVKNMSWEKQVDKFIEILQSEW